MFDEDRSVPDSGAEETAVATSRPLGTAGVIAPALLLAACGGGGGSGGGTSAAPVGTAPAPTPSPTSSPITVVPVTVTAAQASRVLAQATMGATRATIDQVVSRGIEGWITDQMAMPRATSHWDWLVANGYNDPDNNNTQNGYNQTVWRQLIVEPDQLRQRVGMALLEMLVVGIDGINTNWKAFQAAAYLDVLMDNAFGNYRQILDAITYNAAMASYLTFLGNKKANAATGSVPDENYARELMQLFTLGLYQLNMDGTIKTSGGTPLETYTQADVTGLARVFTGFNLAAGSVPDRYRQPLTITAAQNETGTATFLGAITSGGGTAAVKTALDTIFAHPNVPPFVSRQLIQRLVTSNPSPAYVSRVATTFADDGRGVRGNMQAVIRAILLDSEARGDAALSANSAGKLREPIMRLTGWARAYNVTSPSNAWAFGDTSSPATRLGQSPGRSPSVFNFYRPGYTPPATSLSSASLVAPEFQITNEQSVVGYVNYMYSLVANGAGDAKADYSAIQALAGDSAALVAEVNTVLASGQLSAATLAAIRTAVESVTTSTTNYAINRVGIAIMLTLASPDYLTVK